VSNGFRRRSLAELLNRSPTACLEVEATASSIVGDVRARGEAAVREYGERWDGLEPGEPLVIGREAMGRTLAALPPDERAVLERVAGRIRAFADGQRTSLTPFEMAIPGGTAGHVIAPVMRAGCYVPGGRYPLPSSLLMTAITARAAGVVDVWVATPRPNAIMLACGALAEIDGLVRVGGAHAIAALAFGVGPIPSCDMIVGPGNAYVTAAKRLVFGHVGIDAIAGPSELVVLADERADPGLVAADLLAQAEHDPWSVTVLVTTSETLAARVTGEITGQLETLPTAPVARAALENGGAVIVRNLDEAISVCDQLAPEHLQLQLVDPSLVAGRLRHYGALFIGSRAAEVLGDYGAGPNHVLPTGRASRFSGGLSVLSFLRVRTWLEITDEGAAQGMYDDAARLARTEGLPGHARASELRRRA
jgi:phosphoribosyl-ATP pyrophosphohydrolase/phosphoribosyl-AMP cyclohydrolase/histidinol dehydrogenase